MTKPLKSLKNHNYNRRITSALKTLSSESSEGDYCILRASIGPKILIKKLHVVLTGCRYLTRIIRSTSCCNGRCLHPGQPLELFFPDLKHDDLAKAVTFLQTGSLTTTDSERQTIGDILFNIFGLPKHLPIQLYDLHGKPVGIRCPLDCGKLLNPLGAWRHFQEELEDQLKEDYARAESNRVVVCQVCRNAINYITRSGSSDNSIIARHYNNHSRRLKKMIFKESSHRVDSEVDEPDDSDDDRAIEDIRDRPNSIMNNFRKRLISKLSMGYSVQHDTPNGIRSPVASVVTPNTNGGTVSESPVLLPASQEPLPSTDTVNGMGNIVVERIVPEEEFSGSEYSGGIFSPGSQEDEEEEERESGTEEEEETQTASESLALSPFNGAGSEGSLLGEQPSKDNQITDAVDADLPEPPAKRPREDSAKSHEPHENASNVEKAVKPMQRTCSKCKKAVSMCQMRRHAVKCHQYLWKEDTFEKDNDKFKCGIGRCPYESPNRKTLVNHRGTRHDELTLKLEARSQNLDDLYDPLPGLELHNIVDDEDDSSSSDGEEETMEGRDSYDSDVDPNAATDTEDIDIKDNLEENHII